jgi:DNA-binding transcriptional LysR family regulator
MSTANDSRWSATLAALDMNLLVALDALLQEANVTRAARRVGVTQSAMSQTLARLRHQFDDPILVKVGRGLQLTPFGVRIRARLRDALAELEAVVRDRPAFDPSTASCRLALAMVDYLSMVLFPAIQKAVGERAPGIDLAVHALDAVSIAAALERGAVQLYVGVQGDTERALVARPLFKERLQVVVHKRHPLARKRLGVADYVAHPHVHVSPRREGGSVVDRALASAGVARRVITEVPYFGLLPSLLRGSDLVATVPERLARVFAREHGLHVIEPPVELPEIAICMAWHPAFERDPALLWLREVVEQVARSD